MKIRKFIMLAIFFAITIFARGVFAETDQDVTSYFEDENLKNAIIDIIKKTENNNAKNNILLSDIDKITSDSLASGKQLNLAGKNIKNLRGLELFENKKLEWIYLDWNELEDLGVLSNFTTLTKISASNNKISNTAFLSKMSNLQNLNLSNNQIKTIENITELIQLRYLYLENNKIDNIKGISKLTHLMDLSIAGNKISNCDETTQLISLENLDVSRNNISSIEKFSINRTMKSVNLNYNQLVSLNGIDKIEKIEILSASNNKIENIESIKKLSQLYNLNLNKNEIQDISALNNNSAIKYLYLDANHIIDSESIETLENLSKVTIYNQTYNLNITNKIETEDAQIVFTSTFRNLQKKDSKIYVENLDYKMEPNITYKIAKDMSFIIVERIALEKQDLTFTMKDENYNYITLFIHYEPQIEEDDDNVSDIYEVKNNQITEVSTNTTVEKFIQNLKTNQAEVVRNGTVLTANNIVGTGDILNINNKKYLIIVKADLSGNGKTNIMDLMKVKRHVIGSKKLDSMQTLAADLNDDGYIDIMDIMNFIKLITKQK